MVPLKLKRQSDGEIENFLNLRQGDVVFKNKLVRLKCCHIFNLL